MKNRRPPEGHAWPRAAAQPRTDTHRLFTLLLAIAALGLALRLAQAAEATSATDTQRITQMMKAQSDRPGQPLNVEPVAVEGPFAVAGWIQGDAGGRALLQRDGNQWEIVLCSGDRLLQAATLAGTGISVTSAWARATPPGMRMGAAYLTITNRGSRGDVLLGASSPIAAGVEIHRTIIDGGMSRMRPAGEIAIAPGAVLQFEPSGLHMMILDLSAPLVEGNSLALTLRFRNAGSVSVQVAVQALTATSTHHGH